jgi:hypothetical protein
LVFVLGEKRGVKFFVSPVKVFMQFQKLKSVNGFKNPDTGVKATAILHRFNKLGTHLTVNSKILGEVQTSELFSV